MARATTRITTVGRVIVSVSDQDRALDFYEGTLGFEKIADIPFGDGSRWIEVQPPGGGCAIALGRPPEGVPVGGAMTGIVLQTTDVDGDQAALRGAGVRPGGAVPGGCRGGRFRAAAARERPRDLPVAGKALRAEDQDRQHDDAEPDGHRRQDHPEDGQLTAQRLHERAPDTAPSADRPFGARSVSACASPRPGPPRIATDREARRRCPPAVVAVVVAINAPSAASAAHSRPDGFGTAPTARARWW